MTNTNFPVLLQIHLLKIFDKDIPENRPMNLSELQMSELISDILKIPLVSCIELDSQTGRYEKQELLVHSDTDLTNTLTGETPKYFKQHKIRVTSISNAATKVIFNGVPISVPNEELLHLCEHYGDLVDEKVTRQTIRLGNEFKHDILNSTRSVQVRLHPGKFLKNFYWLAGPNQGDRGRRVTVLHNNQPPQCSHCFGYFPPSNHTLGPSQYCKGGGNGKICKSLNTERTSMNAYIKSLREEGYTSLKDLHYDTFNNFPALGRKEPNKTPDPDTTDLEDQLNDDDDDDEPDKQAELVDPTEKTQAEGTSQTDPAEPVETTQEDTTSTTDPTEPDETTQEEEVPRTDPEKSNEISLTKTPNDTTPTDPTEPDETTQEEEVPLTDPKKSNKISLTKTPNDTTPAPPDQSPTPPTKQTPDEENLDSKDATDIPPKSRVRGFSVSMKSMLKPPSSRLPTTQTSPSQFLFPPTQPPPSTPSPSSKSTQGLGSLEFPMIRHMTENRKYNEDELKQYVIEAIKQGEITYQFLKGVQRKCTIQPKFP